MRRPIIIGPGPKEDPLVLWGPRHCYDAGYYLVDLVIEGKYKSNYISNEMKELIGRINNERGNKFTQDVYSWLSNNSDLKIFQKQRIKPGKLLDSNHDIGDIDVLALDFQHYVIYSIECKNIKCGRSPKEIANEIEGFLGNEYDKEGYITKHQRRHLWLKENINILKSAYNLPDHSWKIISFFITSQEIPSIYIKNMPFRLISFSRFKKEGIQFMLDLIKDFL